MTEIARKTEILAPAGSVEQLIAAVNNGCDSVYLGLDSFNARMKAPNFTTENLKQWVDYCHVFGVKVYVAINTSIKNDEFEKSVDLLTTAYLSNADGVILTDLALIRIASQLPKPFDIVASTQLSAHDKFGAEFLKKCGATTVVCARESCLDEISDVASTGVNVECFIHGATCVCQSGQCLFSAMVGGNSGNRGLCAQPCRKLYSYNNGQTWRYLLSARDLCGLDIAERLRDSGVSIFKIEGRNRRAEYAGIAARTYRSLFDNSFQYAQSDVNNLAEMYNREMSTLSYILYGNQKIIAPHTQNHIGVYVGTVKGKGIVAEKEIAKGDGLKVFDYGKEICGAVATSSGTGFVSVEFSGKVRDGMEVRRTTSVKLCDEIAQAKRLLPITLSFTAFANHNAVLAATYNDVTVEITSDFIVQNAENKPIKQLEIAEQLQKTGNSYYTISDIDINIGNIFLAKSQINGMRRCVLEKLQKAIIERYNTKFDNRKSFNYSEINLKNYFHCIEKANLSADSNVTISATKQNNTVSNSLATEQKQNKVIAVICYTKAQLQEAKNVAQYIIYKPEFISELTLNEAKANNAYVDLPAFSYNNYIYRLLSKLQVGIVCHNVGHVELARTFNLPYIAGSGLNIYNDYIASEFKDAVTFVYSQELTLREISQFSNKNGLTFVDGQITLMKVVHCPYKTLGCTCSKCQASRALTYTDELGNKFTFARRKDSRCTFELLNGKKLSVVAKLYESGRYLMDYDKNVVEHYASLNNGVHDGYVENRPYTKGRLYNKVN